MILLKGFDHEAIAFVVNHSVMKSAKSHEVKFCVVTTCAFSGDVMANDITKAKADFTLSISKAF